VDALVHAGERVVVLDNLSTGFATALPARMLPIVGCVSDQTLVAELIEDHAVESIIHFAGSTIVPDSIKDPLGYYGNNTANSRALIGPPSEAAFGISSFPRPRRCTVIQPVCRSARTIPPCGCRPTAGRS